MTVMPEQIQSPSMTADWEEKLLLIERKEYSSEDFMQEIRDVIFHLVRHYEVIQDAEVLMAKEPDSVGKCPICGSPVINRPKGYFCADKECRFALWKNNRYFESIGKKLTDSVVESLLSSGKIKLKGCKSAKTGRTFDAMLLMEVDENGKINFSMEFENGGKKR